MIGAVCSSAAGRAPLSVSRSPTISNSNYVGARAPREPPVQSIGDKIVWRGSFSYGSEEQASRRFVTTAVHVDHYMHVVTSALNAVSQLLVALDTILFAQLLHVIE